MSPLLRPGHCFISSKDSLENLLCILISLSLFVVADCAGGTGGGIEAPLGADTASPLNNVVPVQCEFYIFIQS